MADIIDSLRAQLPRGPWLLGARNRTTGKVYAEAAFAPSQARAARRWIEKQHRKGLTIIAGIPEQRVIMHGAATVAGYITELRKRYPHGPWTVGVVDKHGVWLGVQTFAAGDAAGVREYIASFANLVGGLTTPETPTVLVDEFVAIIKEAWPKPPFDVIATKPDGTLAAQKLCADDGELRRFINLHALELGHQIGARLPS